MKNPGVAAVLSFFYAGLGQIYNGQIIKGLIFMLIYSINIALCWLLVGFITAPLFWLYCMYDAYAVANRINAGEFRL